MIPSFKKLVVFQSLLVVKDNKVVAMVIIKFDENLDVDKNFT